MGRVLLRSKPRQRPDERASPVDLEHGFAWHFRSLPQIARPCVAGNSPIEVRALDLHLALETAHETWPTRGRVGNKAPMSRVRAKRHVDLEEEPLSELEAAPPRASTHVGVVKFILGVAIVLSAASAVAMGAYRFLTTTSRFAIEGVEAQGSQRYSEGELLSLAGITRGTNLFAVDLAAAERTLAENPWIESAHVARKLPNKLTISVEELSAAAAAVIDGTIYLVTREGRPIKPLELGDTGDYPIVTGVTTEHLAADRRLALERIAMGVDVLDYYRRTKLSKAYPAQEVLMDVDGRIRLTIGTPAITLQLGKADYRQKLLMAGRIVSTLRGKGETPTILFLDNEAHPERVVVRLH